MAKREIGTRISLDGEAQFKSAVKNIDQELRVLASEMGAATSAFDKNNASVSDLKTKSEIYAKQIEAQKQKLSEQNKMLEECRAAQEKAAAAVSEAAKKYGEQSDEAKKAEERLAAVNSKLADYQISANNTTKAINKLEAAQRDNNEQIDKLQNTDLDNITNDVKKLGDEAAKAAAAAVTAVAAAVTAATGAIAAFAKSSVEAGMGFDSSMSQVAATMGTTVDQIGNLRDFALEMGSKTAFSASQAADALNYMALAGYDANQSMDMLPKVLNLAAAGGMELAKASDMITDSQSALGLSSEQTAVMVDQMAAASSKTNTSVTQLGDAILTVGGTAKSLSGGTAELSAVLGAMADNGIKGSEAGTHLRNIMLAMNPTTKDAAAAFEQLGINAYDEQGNLRKLETVFMDISAAMDGMSDKEKTDVLGAMFKETDLAAVNALLSTTSERWNEINTALENAGGAAEAMANTQLDNLEGDITLFKSALEGAQIAVSDKLTPSIREFVQFGTDGISQLADAFKGGGLDGAMGKFGEILSNAISMITNMLPQVVNAAMSLIQSLIQGIVSNLPQITDAAVQIVLMLTDGIFANLPMIVDAAMQMILTLADGIAAALPELTPTIVSVILNIVEMMLDNVNLLIDASVAIITGLADGLITALPILLEKMPEIIGKLVTALMEAVPKLIEAAVNIIFNLKTALWDNFPLIIDTIAGMLAEIGLAIANGAKAWVESFEDLGGKIFDWVQNLKVKMKEAFENIIANIKEAIQPALDIGKNIIDGIVNGIKEQVTKVKDKVTGACSELLGDVKEFFGIHSPSTVFEDEVGTNLALGLSEGFTEKMGKLSGEMSDAVPSDYKIGVTVTDTKSAKKAIDVLVKDYESGLLNKAQYDKLYNQTLSKITKEREQVIEYSNQKMVAAEKKAAENRRKNIESISKEQVDDIIKAYKDGEISLSEMQELYTQVYKACTDERIDIEEYAGEKITAARKEVAEKNLKQLKDSIKSEISEYNKQLEDIQKSIESTSKKLSGDIADMYSFEKDDNGKTVAKLNDLSEKQAQLNRYYSNIKKLMDNGVNDAMIEQLANMSLEQGAALAESWAKMSVQELDGVAKKFENITKTSDKISALLYDKKSKQVAQAMIDSMKNITAGSEEFAEMGGSIIDKMISGLTDGSSTSKIKAACDKIIEAFKSSLNIEVDSGLKEQLSNVGPSIDNSVPVTSNGGKSYSMTRQSFGGASDAVGQNTTVINQYNTFGGTSTLADQEKSNQRLTALLCK